MSALSFDTVSIALGRRRIFSGVSFAIEPGEFVGVLGPNGAGKTTMFRAALGLVRQDHGTIDVLGGRPRRGNPAIGYIPQSRRATAQLRIAGTELLLSAHGGERWGWPWRSAAGRREVDAALERVGAAGLAHRPVSELSGGERSDCSSRRRWWANRSCCCSTSR